MQHQQQEDLETASLELTEEQIQAIYIYLAIHYDEMQDEEKLYWNYIMEKIDPEYGKED
jgi:hypothetical protein